MTKEIAYTIAKLYHEEPTRYTFLDAYKEMGGPRDEAEALWLVMDAAVDLAEGYNESEG